MDFVRNLGDIIENIETIDEYLLDPAKQEFAINLIKEGTNFVAVKKEQGYRFYPSRYVGYKNNSYDAHTRHNLEERKDTSPTISQILKHKPDPSQDFEMEYKKFCEDLGFIANDKGRAGVEHKYWVIAIET
jgi:hypothetical protein